MSKNTIITLVVVLLLIGGGYYLMSSGGDTTDETEDTTMMEDEDAMEEEAMEEESMEEESSMMELVELTMTPDAENTDVAQSGTATLEETDDGVVVTLDLSDYESPVAQPAHIHDGACPDVGEVAYPLENVVDGASTTTLEGMTLADLETALPLAVNVHKSADEISVYTSCADLEL